MAERTAISWADATWNPVIGCTKVSPACDGCYAENLMDHRYGRVTWGKPGQRGTLTRTSAKTWNDPIRWNRKAIAAGERPFVFCSSLSDVFDKNWPAEWRREVFDIIRATPALVYLLLTKRPQNIIPLAEAAGGLPANAAIGTTAEDQTRVELNIPHLLAAALKLRALFSFVSIEPMLGGVNLRNIEVRPGAFSFLHPEADHFDALHPRAMWQLGWIITGGETDQGAHMARPTHPEWFSNVADQAIETGVPFHHKQNGEWSDLRAAGATGWRFRRERDGKRYGVVSTGGFEREELLFNGAELETLYPWGNGAEGPPGPCMVKLGKGRTGRLLDGRLHDARPFVKPMGTI